MGSRGSGGEGPIKPGYMLYHDEEKIVIRNYEGKVFEYPENPAPVAAAMSGNPEYLVS